MGGRIFKHLGEPLRLPTERFEPIARAVADATGGRPVAWLRDKPDHGDVDIVLPQSIVDRHGDAALAAMVGAAVGVEHVHYREDCRNPIVFVGLRLPEGIFQVDLIGVPDELVDFAHGVLSWGDLGVMIGRVAREMGITFGMNGLRVPLRVPSAQSRSILLTSDFDDALKHLGLDPVRHRAGFDDIVASADWLADGAYFDPKIYDPSRTTSEARRRSRVRSSQPALVEYLKSRPGRHEWPEVSGPSAMQEDMVRETVERFGKTLEVETARAEMIASTVREETHFSLDAVSAATGVVEPRDVRALVSIMQESFPGTDEFPKWRARAEPDDIAARARAAVPVLIERRMEDARRETRAQLQREAAERKARRTKRPSPCWGRSMPKDIPAR